MTRAPSPYRQPSRQDFSVDIHRAEGRVSVVVRGAVGAEGVPTLRHVIDDLTAGQGNRRVDVDLSSATFADGAVAAMVPGQRVASAA